jgi:hypothetical protein
MHELRVVATLQYASDDLWAVSVSWEKTRGLSVSETAGKTMLDQSMVEQDRSQVCERACSNASTLSNAFWRGRVSVATKACLVVKYRRGRETDPVKRPVPVPWSAINSLNPGS